MSANGVKTDSHQPAGGGEATQTDDNVVRLPREWLGPREDLVQFDGPDDVVAAPPAPEDFWGEGSSELQSAVVGTPSPPPPVDARAAALGYPARVGRRLRRWPARTIAVGAAASALVILAVVVLSILGGQRTGSPHPRLAGLSHPSDTAADSGLLQIASRHFSRKAARIRRGPVAPRRRSRVPRRHPSKGRSTTVAPSGTSTLVASSYSPSSYSPNSSTAYGPSSSASSTGSQPVSSGGAQAASAQSSQPAFGQNGSLGPGRGAANTQ